VAVPDVTGLTRAAAEAALMGQGLALGAVKGGESQIVSAGGVIGTNPPAGRLVNQASRIDLEVSTGPGKNWYIYLPTILISGAVLVLLGVVIYGLYQQGFIERISQERSARGLITFLIAVVTVGIALILVLSNIISEGEDAEKRFDRGKQVLTTMIGVLGTIVGFYFGTAVGPQTSQQRPAITNTTLPDGFVNTTYPLTPIQVSGGIPPLRWSLFSALPPGLSLDAATGVISGTPTEVSTKATYTATVTDSATPANSSTGEITLEIKPQTSQKRPAITNASLPDGAVNKAYPLTPIQVTGGTPPLRWSLVPALPAGLSLDPSTGAISGTPTAASSKSTYTATVTDSAKPPNSSTGEITLEIKQ
jgi:hypothetical protein